VLDEAELEVPRVPKRSIVRARPSRTRPVERRAARALALLAVFAGVRYFVWRTSTLDGTGFPGAVFFAAELLSFLYLIATIVVVWRARSRGPFLPPAPADTTLDVWVTVCGEPLEMVERTIRAAVAIDFPHDTYVLNDGRIADRPGWREVDDLCQQLGVPCFTRVEGARGKAGNLNHALARTQGKLIATIDADHVAQHDFGDAILGYFCDSAVAFVTCDQAFDIDDDPLNNRERFFYEAIQPGKDRDGCAFSTGNATVWRRRALESVGGFSEWNLVEDLHTSYRLHADGWRSAYHPVALTRGTAPTTAGEYLAQRRRWAVDTLRLLIFDCPLVRRGLSPVQRFHYLHTGTSYLLLALNLVFLLGPAAYLLWRVSLVRPASDLDYLGHFVPYAVAGVLFFMSILGVRAVFTSLSVVLFIAPLSMGAVWRALTGRHARGESTRKGRPRRVSRQLLAPLAILVLLVAALTFSFFDQRPGASAIASFWAAMMAAALAGPLSAVTERSLVARRLRRGARLGIVALFVGMIALGATQLPLEDEGGTTWLASASAQDDSTLRGPAVTVPAPRSGVGPSALAPPDEGRYTGIAGETLLSGPDAVTSWSEENGFQPAIVHWFQQWFGGETRFRGDWVDAVHDQGSIPMITWEPWTKPLDSYQDSDQVQGRHEFIVEGLRDDYVRSWAEAIAADGRPILLRPMHEMNGFWYPWSVESAGNSPESFVAAWRRVHRIFTQAGATNVSWVWSVNELRGLDALGTDIERYYPGDEYVDWVGLTMFNWGPTEDWSEWTSGAEILDSSYDALTAFGKPIMLAEIATVDVGGDPSPWVRQFVAALRDYALVKAVVWFDMPYRDGVDFRLGPAMDHVRDDVRSGAGGAEPVVTHPS
jgi:cellulose synthase (UDP-forming)